MNQKHAARPISTAVPAPLVLAGGGSLPGAIFAEVLRLAPKLRTDAATGRTNPRKVGIATFASSYPAESFAKLSNCFRAQDPSLECEHFFLPLLQEDFLRLTECSVLFFSGGDQNKILDAVATSNFEQKMLELWASGNLIVAGTSAGLQVCSPLSLTGEFHQVSKKSCQPGSDRIEAEPSAELETESDNTATSNASELSDKPYLTVAPNQVETRKGFSFLKSVILDQHFLRRQRQNRLFAACLDNAGYIGLGVDEESALVIEAFQKENEPPVVAKLRVLGNSSVFYCDGTRQNQQKSTVNSLSSATQLSCGFVWEEGQFPFYLEYDPETLALKKLVAKEFETTREQQEKTYEQ